MDGQEGESAPEASPVIDEINALLRRAREGDSSELSRLRQVLDANPEIWKHYGNLANHAQDAWIRLIGGVNLALIEAVGRKLAALKEELAGPSPRALERLLIERVAAAWLQLHWAEAITAQAAMDPSTSIRQAQFAQKRQEHAQRMYLTALGALATYQKLLPEGERPSASSRKAKTTSGGVPPEAAGKCSFGSRVGASVGLAEDLSEPIKLNPMVDTLAEPWSGCETGRIADEESGLPTEAHKEKHPHGRGEDWSGIEASERDPDGLATSLPRAG